MNARERFVALALAAVVALLAPSSPSLAQEQDTAGAQPSREELEGMMDAYIVSKLQEALGLTDEQFGRMVVAQKKLQDSRREYRRGRAEILRELRRTLRRDAAGEEELAPLLERLGESKKAFQDEERARYRDIDGILDVRQRARYRILETEIQGRLQQLMRRARDRARGREREPDRPRSFPRPR